MFHGRPVQGRHTITTAHYSIHCITPLASPSFAGTAATLLLGGVDKMLNCGGVVRFRAGRALQLTSSSIEMRMPTMDANGFSPTRGSVLPSQTCFSTSWCPFHRRLSCSDGHENRALPPYYGYCGWRFLLPSLPSADGCLVVVHPSRNLQRCRPPTEQSWPAPEGRPDGFP